MGGRRHMTYEYTTTHQSIWHFMVENIFIRPIAWRTQTNTVCLWVLPRLCLSINQSPIHIQICWCMDALLTDTIISNCMCRDQGSHVCYSWIWLWGMLIDKANLFQNCLSANKDFKTKLIRHFSSLLDITNIKNCKLQYHSFLFHATSWKHKPSIMEWRVLTHCLH